MNDEITVVHAAERMLYEVRVNGKVVGFANAIPRGQVITVPHVEVDPAYEGRGLGSRLVKEMLDDLRAHNLRIAPLCPFVASYIRRHPEYADLAT